MTAILFAHAGDNAEVMGYHYDAHAELLSEFLHKLEYLSLNGNVESRCGLVGYEQFGLAREWLLRYHYSLTHTAGELMGGYCLRRFVGSLMPTKLGSSFARSYASFFALARMQADNLGYLIADIDRVEARHGILEDYRDLVALILRIFFFAHLFRSDDR